MASKKLWSLLTAINLQSRVDSHHDNQPHYVRTTEHGLAHKTPTRNLSQRSQDVRKPIAVPVRKLSPAILSQFILEVCAAAEDRKNQ